MPRYLHSRRTRILAVAVISVLGPLTLLVALSISQIRHVADALRLREAEAVQQCARSAAQELAYRILQREGEVIEFLELESPETLTQSLALAETAFPGMTGFILLRDGTFLYPSGTVRSPALAALRQDVDEVFDALDADGVGRLSRIVDGELAAISLHEMESASMTGAVGMVWGRASAREWGRAVEPAVLPSRFELAILGADDRMLFDSGRETLDAAKRDKSAISAVHPLPATLFPWRVRVQPRDAAEIDRIVRRQVLLDGGALLFLAGVIAAGAWLLVAMTIREVRLAKLKADFAANVSHELRTPLALIRAAGESLVGREGLSKAQSDRYAEIVVKESQRLTALINTVLDFSHIEQRKKPYDLAPHDLCSLVNDLVQTYRRHAEEQGFVFHMQVPAEPVLARLEPETFRLVLDNLLDNAIKFAAERKEITVRVARAGEEAFVAVQDRGVGIAPEHQERIFESFYRVEGDLVKKTRGTGIGLALARRIVDAHHGRITVRSRAGEGATFTVWLPLAPEKPAHRGQ